MAKSPTSTTDHDWEGRSDARSLVEAHQIKRNPKRLKKAKKHLGRMHEEAKDNMIAAKAAQTQDPIKAAAGAFLKRSRSQPYAH